MLIHIRVERRFGQEVKGFNDLQVEQLQLLEALLFFARFAPNVGESLVDVVASEVALFARHADQLGHFFFEGPFGVSAQDNGRSRWRKGCRNGRNRRQSRFINTIAHCTTSCLGFIYCQDGPLKLIHEPPNRS